MSSYNIRMSVFGKVRANSLVLKNGNVETLIDNETQRAVAKN